MIQTKTHGDLEYLTAEHIHTPHCFTTRRGGVSTGTQSSLNLAIGRGDILENVEQNLRILARELDFDPRRLVMTHQNHSNLVRVVSDADAQGLCHRAYPHCDGLVTATPGTALLIFTADCTPILFWDEKTGAVGAAHAGWRGTAQNIAGRVVETMARSFGSEPENIHAAIGPNIGQCHFETDWDVPEALVKTYGEEVLGCIEKRGEKYHPDIKAVNALALRRAGVKQLEISDACTYCQHDRFWSHRFTKGERGSQGALIVCREAKP